MSEDFSKLPDVVTGEWVIKWYDRLETPGIIYGDGGSVLANLINETRAADRQEIDTLKKNAYLERNEYQTQIDNLRARLAAYEEREKQNAVDAEKWWDDQDILPGNERDFAIMSFCAARIGWEPKRDPSEWLCVEWPKEAVWANTEWYSEESSLGHAGVFRRSFLKHAPSQLPAASAPVVPSDRELHDFLFKIKNEPGSALTLSIMREAQLLREFLLAHGYRESPPEMSQHVGGDLEKSIFDGMAEAEIATLPDGITIDLGFKRTAALKIARRLTAPSPSDPVREAAENIRLADKLIRFDSEEPLWVRIGRALDCLEKALAALSTEVKS